MTRTKSKIGLILLWMFSVPAFGLDYGLSFEQLSYYWGLIEEPSTGLYASLDTAEVCSSEPPSENDGLRPPLRGSIPRDSGSAPSCSYFKVLDPRINASGIYRRAVRLDQFHARVAKFNGIYVSSKERTELNDNADAINERKNQRSVILDKWQNAVSLERYLVRIMEFYAAESFPAKCDKIKQADEIYNGVLVQDSFAETLPEEWKTILASVKPFIDDMQSQESRYLVCSLSEISSKGEIVEDIKEKLRTELGRRLEEKLDKEIAVIGSADSAPVSDDDSGSEQTPFQQLGNLVAGLDEVSVDLEEILKFMRDLANAKGNMNLVGNDSLGVGSRVTTYRNAQHAALDENGDELPGATSFKEIRDATASNATLAGTNEKLQEYHGEMVKLFAAVTRLQNAMPAAGVSQCNDLGSGAFAAIDGIDIGQLYEFIEEARLCVDALKTEVLAKSIKNSAFPVTFSKKNRCNTNVF